MQSTRLDFENARGEKLSARLDLPVDGEPRAYVLFAHCFTCSKNLRAVSNISRALTQRGFAVLRFDFTGLGESEVDFADTNFSSNVEDLVYAARFLEQSFRAPDILVGHSLGGAAVLQAASQLPQVRAVATIGAPADPEHVTHLLEEAREDIEKKGQANVQLAGRTFTIKKQFLDDLEGSSMENYIRSLKRPLLIFHSPIDNTVGIENAAKIFQHAMHPKSFVSLDKADHLLTDQDDSRYVGAVLAAWAAKYIPAPAQPQHRQPEAEANRIVVQTGAEGFVTTIMANGHALVADEPLKLGGTNQGPTPYELLAASLGACTSITLRMYADRKKWPLEAVTVRLTHQKIHGKDCEVCETNAPRIDRFDREIELEGPLSEDQRQRLLEIADKCPVHRTLHSEIWINTTLKDS